MKRPLDAIGGALVGFLCGGGLVAFAHGPSAPPEPPAPTSAPASPASSPPASPTAAGAPPSHAVLATEPVTVRFENEYVRVFDVLIHPGERVGMHSHNGRVGYVYGPYKMKFSYPDGTSQIVEKKGGEVSWHDPTTHAAENIGTVDFHVLTIELKAAVKK